MDSYWGVFVWFKKGIFSSPCTNFNLLRSFKLGCTSETKFVGRREKQPLGQRPQGLKSNIQINLTSLNLCLAQ